VHSLQFLPNLEISRDEIDEKSGNERRREKRRIGERREEK
jgi:hypothetical protein